eukprot:6383421-Ditylum_brightwellii.AAC.2
MNKQIAPSNNGVTLPDGSKKRASMIADLDMMVCDRTGNSLFKPSMKNSGWLLHGNNNELWITKSDHKVKFDIRIKPKRG